MSGGVVDVRNMGLSGRGLRKYVSPDTRMTQILASGNQLGLEGALVLVDAIALGSVVDADVTSGGLGMAGMGVLGQAIAVSDTLVSLSMGWNAEEGEEEGRVGEELADGVRASVSLQLLDLRGNGLSQAAKDALDAAVRDVRAAGREVEVLWDPQEVIPRESQGGEPEEQDQKQDQKQKVGRRIRRFEERDEGMVEVVEHGREMDAKVLCKMLEYLASPSVVRMKRMEVDRGVAVVEVEAPFLLLSSLLEGAYGMTIPLDPPEVVVQALVAAVATLAERSVVHLGLTPAAFARYEETWKIRDLDAATLEGTPLPAVGLDSLYTPPEIMAGILRGAKSVSGSVESMYWSLGVILLHLLSGPSFASRAASVSFSPPDFVSSLVADVRSGVLEASFPLADVSFAPLVLSLLAIPASQRTIWDGERPSRQRWE